MAGESSGNETPMYAAQERIRWGNLIFGLGIMIALPGVFLFVASGRLDWFWGWVYVGLTAIFTIGSRMTIAIKMPELVAERRESLQKGDVKSWDRVILPLTFILPIVMFIIAGLDNRFGWSLGIPLSVHVTGMISPRLVTFLAPGRWSSIVSFQRRSGYRQNEGIALFLRVLITLSATRVMLAAS